MIMLVRFQLDRLSFLKIENFLTCQFLTSEINFQLLIIRILFFMQFKKNNSSLSRGFTLVELLIVVALIIILISIILVSTSDSKGKANRSAFLNELRGSISGLALQCNSGVLSAPTNLNNGNWTVVSANCGVSGNGKFCLSVSNKNAFVSTGVGGCTVFVGSEGIFSDNGCTIPIAATTCK